MRRGSGSSTQGDQGLRGLRAAVGAEQQIEAHPFFGFWREASPARVPVWLVTHNSETGHQGRSVSINCCPEVSSRRLLPRQALLGRLPITAIWGYSDVI